MKLLSIIFLVLFAFKSNALEYTLLAEGRSTTGDASPFSGSNFTNASATNFGGGVLASFTLPMVFFRTGLLYVPRTYQYNTGLGSGYDNYTMNCLDVPAWAGLSFGWFGIYAGADLGFKMSSAQGNGNGSAWAGTVTFADNSTFVAPQAGIDINLIKFRITAFYEAQTTISTASNSGVTAAVRGTAVGAKLGFVF